MLNCSGTNTFGMHSKIADRTIFSEGSLEKEMVLVWLAEMLIELITQSSFKFNNFMFFMFIYRFDCFIRIIKIKRIS